MTKTGLVSITFRKLTPQQVVELCQQAGVDAIEWGGDVHVPHGDLDKAQEVAQLSREAGLEIAAYGSYYRTVDSEAEGLPFEQVLETAKALGAPTIRVWPGTKSPSAADEAYANNVIANLKHICSLAAAAGISISLEFHRNTLTETLESAVKLLESVDHPNLKTLWQPTIGMTHEEHLACLRAIKPWLNYFHVFTWAGTPQYVIKHPLSEGEGAWKDFFDEVQPAYALIEFVKDGDLEQFVEDAAALKSWVSRG